MMRIDLMRKDTLHFYLFGAVVVLIAGCTPKPGDQGYQAWVRNYENGLHVSQAAGEFVFDLQYQPSELVWMQRNGAFNKVKFENERQDSDGVQYFTLNIKPRTGDKTVIDYLAADDKERKKELLYYFSYRFQEALSIEDEDIQLPCVLYHYEQHGTQSFVLGFEKPEKLSNEVVLRIDPGILNADAVKIKVSTNPQEI